MAKFRKQTVMVEAVQWKDGKISEIPVWITDALYKQPKEVGMIMRFKDEIRIFTSEGEMTATDGDYIIKNTDGEIYTCKPDLFSKIYEKI